VVSPLPAGLAALALGGPLVVLAQAAGAYDDVKAWWLVLVAAATVVAAALVDPRRLRPPADPDRLARALRVGIAVYAGWHLVTTAVSLSPLQSLVGNFGRGLGLFAFLAAAATFAWTQAAATTRDQTEAVVDAVLWGSAPVCLLALGQLLQLDALPPSWDPVVSRLTIRSTFGQHIFLGSYLVILAPLTLGRLSGALADRRPAAVDEPRRPHPAVAVGTMAGWTIGALILVAAAGRWPVLWWALGAWALVGAWLHRRAPAPVPAPVLAALLVIQAFVVVASQARGAFLALLAGLVVAGVPILWARRARKTLVAAAAVVAVVVGVLVLANVPGSPFSSTRLPLLRRMDQLLVLKPGTPEWFRVQVWRGIVDGWRGLARGEPRVPAGSPRLRALIGYGLETQIYTLDAVAQSGVGILMAQGEGFRARYVVDRAHSAPLDHLVTGGAVGLLLWVGVTAGVLLVGVRRTRVSSGAEQMIRLGALGAVAAHGVDGVFGIDTPIPLALYWLAAAVLTAPPWSTVARAARESSVAWRWVLAGAIGVLALAAVVASTRWLLASVAYAEATRSTVAGRGADALAGFERARALMPWVSLSGEASAYVLLRLAAVDPDPARDRGPLRRAETVLAETRAVAGAGGSGWSLAAQVSFARFRAGDAGSLATSLAAFDRAIAWRPADSHLRAQWAWALLERGQTDRALHEARVVLTASRDTDWLAWGVVARAAARRGDAGEAQAAAQRAELQAPAETRAMLSRFLRQP
jgi:hypothetical protein